MVNRVSPSVSALSTLILLLGPATACRRGDAATDGSAERPAQPASPPDVASTAEKAAPEPPFGLVGIELPRAAPGGGEDWAPVNALELAADGSVRVNGLAVEWANLAAVLQAAIAADPTSRAVLSAEPTCLFRDVARLVDELRAAGFKRIALSTGGVVPPPMPLPPLPAPPAPDPPEPRRAPSAGADTASGR